MPGMRAACVKGFQFAVLFLLVCFARADAFAESEQNVMVVCHIRVTLNDVTVRLDAVAGSRENMSGRYRFELLKKSETGTSRNVQSGAFNLKANAEDVLTTTFLDSSALGHYQAKLVLDTSSGSVSCVSP
jgi:hypothetical protein